MPWAGSCFILGLGFLAEWLYDSWSKFPPSDYAIVVLILGVMGTFGYLEGVGLGLLAAVFLFIHNYSRVGVITHVLTGAEFQSNVDRPPAHQRLLKCEGGGLHLLKLQGFIFFGTANTLLQNIRARANHHGLPRLKCVVLDFRRVNGLDSSAALSLTMAVRLARKAGFRLMLTEAPKVVQNQLRRGLLLEDQTEWLTFFPDLDHALESWEGRVLASRVESQSLPPSLRDLLAYHWTNPHTLDSFLARLERRVLRAGYLIRRN